MDLERGGSENIPGAGELWALITGKTEVFVACFNIPWRCGIWGFLDLGKSLESRKLGSLTGEEKRLVACVLGTDDGTVAAMLRNVFLVRFLESA